MTRPPSPDVHVGRSSNSGGVVKTFTKRGGAREVYVIPIMGMKNPVFFEVPTFFAYPKRSYCVVNIIHKASLTHIRQNVATKKIGC